MELDYARGHHVAWDRALHREERKRETNGERPLSCKERAGFVDRYIRQHHSKADAVVECEVCQEQLGKHGGDFDSAFPQPPDAISVARELRIRRFKGVLTNKPLTIYGINQI